MVNTNSLLRLEFNDNKRDLEDNILNIPAVEFEIITPNKFSDERRAIIDKELASIDEKLVSIESKVAELNKEIDKLINHADCIDYTVAVISGILTGILDSVIVGETEIDENKVQEMLEKKYHVANDSAYKHKMEDGHWVDSPLYHRLDDLAHHPTLLGLVSSILVRYIRLVIFIDGTDGKPHIFFADKSVNEATNRFEKEQLLKAWAGAVISGLCLWLATVAERRLDEKYEGDLPNPLRNIIRTLGKIPLAIEILKAADTWIGHMMSDVSTSQGIPGIFLSLLKEISVLPGIRDTDFRVKVDGLYNKGNFNLGEWGGIAFNAVKKQSMPVIINEMLVRGFYFIRRLITELKTKQNFKEVDWQRVIPINNRTVVRMITISTGTFMTVDLADAGIRAVIKSGGINPMTLEQFILRVNFVGVGRFAIAVGTDIGMGIKKTKVDYNRRRLVGEQIALSNAKLYYKNADLLCSYGELYEAEAKMHATEADLWVEVKSTEEMMVQLQSLEKMVATYLNETINENIETIYRMGSISTDDIETYNPGLMDEIFRR